MKTTKVFIDMDVPRNTGPEEISEQSALPHPPSKVKRYLNNDPLDDPLQRMSFQRHLESVLIRDFEQEENEARQKVRGFQDSHYVEFDEIRERVSRFGSSVHAKGSASTTSSFHANDIPRSFDESLRKEFEATQKRIDQFKINIH
ncbi:hypothetical protein K493DRAFT_346981 [Basidiobolus meristosporus CBS 931.73]|uniref:Uncharacterized protein n=1 Tax=Basidiobolus meristosporus CBS 931.73 TaxID=1314790 RepID=A0A1Y1YW22_9FUNG|nr:hypothetical protein K493DRAFT_346981 [Basidiobolus meristosporus CBS 931.73]|eukprot:ORY01917.1 hypothetical protein K493DRAFT_346981 [Basidiobolus meristosporus CBS 931.73]